jgi:hypothetical protein
MSSACDILGGGEMMLAVQFAGLLVPEGLVIPLDLTNEVNL